MEKTLESMNSDERSLLLYIESVSCDYGGLVHSQRINDADLEILKQWDKEGFISFSRITWDSMKLLVDKHTSNLVRLSESAWKLAHEERRARFLRMSSKPPICNLKTTKTKNSKMVVAEEGND